MSAVYVVGLLVVLFGSADGIEPFDTYTQYGRAIRSLSTIAHEVQGDVYAVAPNRLRIRGFTYDGSAPDAYFFASDTGSEPSSAGVIVPDELGTTDVLGPYNNADIILTLPSPLTVNSIRWFSVWCRDYNAIFGDIRISQSETITEEFGSPQNIGPIVTLAHGVSATEVTILSANTIQLHNLHYDGRGPDAFFLVGVGSTVEFNQQSIKVPDENGNVADPISGYNGETITIQLPADRAVQEFDWLSLYCIQYTENFGNVRFPDNLVVPPALPENPSELPSDMDNCHSYHDRFRLLWESNTTHITYQLEGLLESDEYMAFGVSGSNSSSSMSGADVVVVYYTQQHQPQAVDYKLTDYAQCSGGSGACPDEAQGAIDDVILVGASRVHRRTKVKVTRPLDTGDSDGDAVVSTSSLPYVVWAIGKINSANDYLVTKHSIRSQGDIRLTTGRSQCRELTNDFGSAPSAWAANIIRDRSVTTFTATIGPTGGPRGAEALTGIPSWGISWYINGLLMPEIYVERGVSYTFEIQGGDEPARQASYHPLYLTDDPMGGYNDKTAAERQSVGVFAGVDSTGEPTSDSVGTLCEYQETEAPELFDTFDEYADTLVYHCPDTRNTGSLVWTPDADTPDLLYYQCYTHNYLGWKIHVVDDIMSGSSPVSSAGSVITLLCTAAAAVAVALLHVEHLA